MNIGVIGYGIVGKAHFDAFERKATGTFLNDPRFVQHAAYRTLDNLIKSDLIFVCVPTPFDTKTSEVDTSILYEVLQNLQDEVQKALEYNPVVCIKSAVPPSTVRDFKLRFKGLRLTVSPEYLSERKPFFDLVHQETLIVGGDLVDAQVIKKAYQEYSITNPHATFGHCTAEEAALVKYMENNFLAMKVIFMNEFKRYYDAFFKPEDDTKFNSLIPVYHLDSRMGGPYPYTIPGPDGHLGFGGKCLPKDLLGMVAEAKKVGVEMPLLEAAWEENLEIREDRNWEEIAGAVQ